MKDFRIKHSFRKRKDDGLAPCTYVTRGTQKVALFRSDYFLTIEDRAEYQHKVTRSWLFCCYTKTKIQLYFLLSFLYESVSIIVLLKDQEVAVQNRSPWHWIFPVYSLRKDTGVACVRHQQRNIRKCSLLRTQEHSFQ